MKDSIGILSFLFVIKYRPFPNITLVEKIKLFIDKEVTQEYNYKKAETFHVKKEENNVNIRLHALILAQK
ncbi:hypothetical protein GCM10017706_20520 [Lactococcus lactis subsp. hordniae]